MSVTAIDRRLQDSGALDAVLHHPQPRSRPSRPTISGLEPTWAWLRSISGLAIVEPRGHWLPILGATRMPSVFCTLDPPERVVEETVTVAAAVHQALKQWVTEPIQHEA